MLADEIVNRTARSAVYDSSEVDLSVDFSYPTSDQLALPSQTSLLSERACRTVDGNVGTCGSIRDCYPSIKLPESKNVEKWIIDSSGSCNYAKSNGKEVETSWESLMYNGNKNIARKHYKFVNSNLIFNLNLGMRMPSLLGCVAQGRLSGPTLRQQTPRPAPPRLTPR